MLPEEGRSKSHNSNGNKSRILYVKNTLAAFLNWGEGERVHNYLEGPYI
jgi:hypothetical protein